VVGSCSSASPSPLVCHKIDRISARSGVGFFVGSGWTGLEWIVVGSIECCTHALSHGCALMSGYAKIGLFGVGS
jgi:hypothetical protein